MQQRGFTLIELMVSVTIFVIVMVISLGALLSISAAERKAEALKTVMNNLNFGLESMARSIRTGVNYHCTSSGTLDQPLDCSNGNNYFAFEAVGGDLDDSSDQVVYRLETSDATLCGQSSGAVGCVVRSLEGGQNGTFYQVTAPEVVVTSLMFYVIGTYRFPSSGVSACSPPPANQDCVQPKVVITLNGSISAGTAQPTEFNLQTSVTQRLYDQ